MPLLTQHRSGNVEIALWRIDESEAELLQLLPPQHAYAAQVQSMKSAKRRCEWLATRALLHACWGEETTIDYRSDGSPLLRWSDGHHSECSISHSGAFVALASSKSGQPLGIDMEENAERASKLRHRYLTPLEQSILLESGKYEAVDLWCAKEAVFKLCRTPGLAFLTQIQLRQEGCLLRADLPTLQAEAQIDYLSFDSLSLALATYV